MANRFTDPVIVKKIYNTCFWEVMAPFTFHLGSPDGVEFVTIPVGRITDFASIPPPASWIWKSPGSNVDAPALVHDGLYTTPRVQHVNGTWRFIERTEADAIFLEALSVPELGISRASRRSLWLGVRVGGGRAWDKWRRLDDQSAHL